MGILDAVRAGNLEALRESLAAGADPRARDGAGLTPLGVAAQEGRVDVVRALIKYGADANDETADPTGMARPGEPVRPMLVAGLSGRWQAYHFLALRTRKSFRNAALKQLKRPPRRSEPELRRSTPVRARCYIEDTIYGSRCR